MVDIRAFHMDSHSPCLADVGLAAIVASLVGQDGGHEMRRVVNPQICALEGDHGIGG